MHNMKLAAITVLVGICAAFTHSSTPEVMYIQSEPEVWCDVTGDWRVEGFAVTGWTGSAELGNNEDGHVWVGIEWEISEGSDTGAVGTGGAWEDRDGNWVRADTYDSGTGNFSSGYCYLQWWTYHDAEVGTWYDSDETYSDIVYWVETGDGA